MDIIKACPMCGKKHKVIESTNATVYVCNENRQYYLHDSIFCRNNPVETERRLNVIYNFIERKPYASIDKYYWKFFYDPTETQEEINEKVNVYRLMKGYPIEVADRVDRILLNLAREYPLVSDMFGIRDIADKKFRMFYCESDNHILEVCSIISFLERSGYIELAMTVTNDPNHEKSKYRIAIEGWKKISDLKKTSETSKQGFIAMSFDHSVEYIELAFKKAITEAGYTPQIIKDKEHNNYIMPEIFHEIRLSRFVVVDVTKPNLGAYYEAGYAQALGKEVIVCCKKETFDDPQQKPHFDIAQKSMIIWQDEDDLIKQLVRRIDATV